MIPLLNRRAMVLVDDDDEALACICLRRAELSNEWVQLVNLVEFLRFHQEAPLGSKPAPALVLSDIHAPQLSGFSVLCRMRAAPPCPEPLRFVMLSNSDSPEPRTKALQLRAAWFDLKPVSVDEYTPLFRSFELGAAGLVDPWRLLGARLGNDTRFGSG